MKKTLIILSLFAFGAYANPVNLDCLSLPGSTLCEQLNEIEDSFKLTCQGNACDGLWASQVNMMNKFVDTYNASVTPGSTAKTEMGAQANLLAHKICVFRFTGEPGQISELVMTINRFLRKTFALQNAAAYPNPYTCTMKYY